MARFPLFAAAAAAATALALAPATAGAVSDTFGLSTLEQRVLPPAQPSDGYDFLELRGGEPYLLREDLAKSDPARDARRRSLAFFAQLSDFQLADEESPARVEMLDQSYSAFSAAWRPFEALIPHMVDASIRQVNANQTSRVRQGNRKRAALGFAILTGDNADSQQLNETRWVDRLLEGGLLNPNSGSADAAAFEGTNCPPGAATVLGPDEAARYTGVQDFDDHADSGTYYDPDQPQGQWAGFPLYAGLMDRAQAPFETPGLNVPSYVALGNHDALVQGNEDANSEFNRTAVGCLKPSGPALSAGDPAGAFAQSLLTTSPERTLLVPPDPDRRFVTKREYRAEFAGGRQGDAHGFAFVDREELEASAGAASYYSFSPAPGLRFVALDTVANGGVAGVTDKGNLDDPQFRWFEQTLEAAQAADELVVVYSHHAPVSMTADVPDEAAGPCDDPDRPTNPGCDMDPRDSAPLHLGEDTQALVAEYPHVIAWVAGHSHVNDVEPVKPTRADGKGGFWIIRTSAEADYPHQDRLIEIMDNKDGTLSLFGTLLDQASPSRAIASSQDASGLGKEELASIGRTLGYNDPQRDPTAEGEPNDRNVELIVRDPRRSRGEARESDGTSGARSRRLRLTVRPYRVRAGVMTRFKLRLTRGGKPVRRARLRVAGRTLRTGRRGRAVIRLRFKKTGVYRVRTRGATAPILVIRR